MFIAIIRDLNIRPKELISMNQAKIINTQTSGSIKVISGLSVITSVITVFYALLVSGAGIESFTPFINAMTATLFILISSVAVNALRSIEATGVNIAIGKASLTFLLHVASFVLLWSTQATEELGLIQSMQFLAFACSGFALFTTGHLERSLVSSKDEVYPVTAVES